jgi:steroid delta-isomerase-like uncharacterized protein
MASVEELARAGMDQYNRGDIDGMRERMAPDFVYEETGTGRRTGPDETAALLRAWRAAFPDVTGTIERLVADRDTVALEVTWRGTHTGALTTPTGELAPTGRTVEGRATLWEVWRDGEMVSMRHHLDMLSLLVQVGALGLAA